MDGCKCAQCWSLAEFMAGVTGKDYGLSPAPGHHGRLVVTKDPMVLTPDEVQALRNRPRRKALPWEMDAA